MVTTALPLVDARLAERHRRALAQEMIIRISVAVVVLAFNEAAGLTIDKNPFIRDVAYVSLLLNVPYYLCARSGWQLRLQAYVRMIGDVSLVSFGLWGAGGLAAAASIGVYSIVSIYAGLMLSSRACLIATAVATMQYLALAALPSVSRAVPAPHAWHMVAFNLFVLNIVGVLTAVLANALRQSRRRTQASEERFSAVAQSAIDAIVSADAAGRIVSWNATAEAMFGYPESEILGEALKVLVPERYRAQHDEAVGRLAQTAERRVIGQTVELEGLRKDGSAFPMELALSSWRTPEGPCFSAIIRDITERKRVERALRESEERFRGLFEHAAFGVYRTMPDGRIVLVNPALARMLGYARPDDLVDRNLYDESFAAGARGRFAELMARDGQVSGFQSTWSHRDGRLIFVQESAKTIRGEDGQAQYCEGIVEDVTERKSLEEQLRQSQKMDAIGRLAGGVAHDFNNLLTAILGYSSLIGRTVPAGHLARERADEIARAATRAASLTRQLLAFSRGQVLETSVIDLNGAIREMEDMLRRLIGEDVEVATHLDPEIAAITADGGQLEQVVLNLAINARDAMPDGGRLTIETANVELDAAYARAHVDVAAGPYVMLAVSDTGSGMDADTQSHIFEPFYTTKGAGKGTGLGLATVYGIVKQSGGTIGVYSEVGRGSTFRIYFPCARQGAPSMPATCRAVDLPGGSERILVVEDNDSVRELTVQVLRERGYTVLAAESPIDALELVAGCDDDLDLMLTDVIMPRMSGRDLSRRVVGLRPALRVLYMSGYAGGHLMEGQTLGPGSEFLSKPFTPEALTRKVRDVLDRPLPLRIGADEAVTVGEGNPSYVMRRRA